MFDDTKKLFKLKNSTFQDLPYKAVTHVDYSQEYRQYIRH